MIENESQAPRKSQSSSWLVSHVATQ